MAMDALEREHWRKNIAQRVVTFLSGQKTVDCISAHWVKPPQKCELCDKEHDEALLVIKNTRNKKMKAALYCLKELIKFQVIDIENLNYWLEKIKHLKEDFHKREEENKIKEQERRAALEKRVVIRKRKPQ